MRDIFSKLKIPTLLGLGIIFVGIIAGVFLTLKGQVFTSQASVNAKAENITLSNISDNAVTISWQTSVPTPSFVTFGQTNPNETTVLDDRDPNTPPKSHFLHYVTLKNLLPKTVYQYKIISGKISTETDKFTTAAPLTSQSNLRPIIGSILDGDKPLNEGIVYLSIADTPTQSALVNSSGNFLIPISQIRKSDLSDIYSLNEETTAKLTVVSGNGEVSALFKLKPEGLTLPTLKLGQNVDLTTPEQTPQPTPNAKDLNKYDLNGDGKINAADNSIVLQNFGKNGQGVKGDINGDRVVDQKDLDLMSKQINQ